MNDDERRNEIQEAIRAGERALESLESARKQLESARKWGYFDMFGGGLVTTMVKHSRLNDASSYLEQARSDLRRFKKELGDISEFGSLGIEVGDFLSFADFFFDGIVADWMVQKKIEDAESKVEAAVIRVNGLLRSLRACE